MNKSILLILLGLLFHIKLLSAEEVLGIPAATIQVKAIKFLRDDGLEVAPSSAIAGQLNLTLQNTSSRKLVNLFLNPIAGKCIKEVAPYLFVNNLNPQESRILGSSILVKIMENCREKETASILLFGAFTNSNGDRETVWSTFSFPIGG